MTYQHILFDVQNCVARLALNRPDKLNSFIGAMHVEIQAALNTIQSDKTIRVLVLSAAGRAFCAGQDLGDPEMAMGASAPDIGNVVEKVLPPVDFESAEPAGPHHCSSQRHCRWRRGQRGAGLRPGHRGAIRLFLQAFSKIGLVPDTGGTWFLPQRVGMARAIGLAMLADKLPAEKAAEWGLIWQVVDDADLAATVDKLAAQLATMPTKALVRTRQAMHAAPTHTLEQQLSMEGGFMRELGWSPDYAEGVSAFMEKRAPKFTGQ